MPKKSKTGLYFYNCIIKGQEFTAALLLSITEHIRELLKGGDRQGLRQTETQMTFTNMHNIYTYCIYSTAFMI